MVHSAEDREGAMHEQVIDRTATTGADPAAVYALLADGSTWPEWSPLGSFTLLDPGDGVPEGLGAVRRFRTGRTTSRERVVERTPDTVFSYVLESGLPLRDYRAVVTLTPTAGGTSIKWRSTFWPKVPGTGWIYRRQLGRFIGRTVAGLAEAAERARPA
jgi:Polyketide cyclase / dehydrase and lipid transport